MARSILQSMFTITFQIQRQSVVTDAYGANRPGTWATHSTVLGWLDTNLKKEFENILNRDEQESDGLCFLPPDADVVGTDRLVANGVTYQVFGIPALVPGRYGAIDHIECRIKRYAG